MNSLTRRDVLSGMAAGAASLALSPFFSLAQNAPGRGKKILFFTRSADFPHAVVTRNNPDELAFAEKVFKDVMTAAGYEVTVSKDGGLFDPGKIEQWDAFAFYTTGRLDAVGARGNSDKSPPMSAEGKAAFFKAIQSGKGLVGIHSASDTFRSQRFDELLRPADAPAHVDPYIAMLGGEFTRHGAQQKSMIRVADGAFPGFDGLKDYEMTEEWYALANIDPRMHVLLVQDTTTMIRPNGQAEAMYRRDPYPCTWAKRHGQGRVFYTSMGHREDVWTNPVFQQVMKAGVGWASGNFDAETPPNLEKACPTLAGAMRQT